MNLMHTSHSDVTVTIITVVRNAERHIERTLQSVFSQTYRGIEYIVVDGASTDSTMDIVRRHESQLSRIISEPDAGISDAWNKGLKLATGQVVGLLNAGDTYASDAVEAAVRAFESGADLIYGDVDLIAEDGAVLRRNRGRFSLWYYSAGFGFYHPSCFASRSLYDRIGGFDLKYRRAMDSDWIARAVKGGAAIRHAPVRATMLDGGISVSGRFLAYGEHLHALQQAGFGARIVYGGMLITAARGLLRAATNSLRRG